jgi:hypothetical protein
MTSKTVALPLFSGLDNLICFLLMQYFATNVWMSQVFQTATYPYVKDDLASIQRPAVLCYPLESSKNSFGYSQNGYIVMELHFSLQEQRVSLAQNVIQIANLIQLINLNQKFTQYLQEYMAGLFWFGKSVKTDYRQVYQEESVVKLVFDYNIDLLAYQKELQNQGYDITSPDEQIYVAAQALLETIAVLNPDQTVAFEV